MEAILVKGAVIVAAIAAFPSTLAAVLGYLANNRSLRRTVGEPEGMPLARMVERLAFGGRVCERILH
jgi:hypothetical protein